MRLLEVNFEGYVFFHLSVVALVRGQTALVKSVTASAIAIKEVCKGSSDWKKLLHKESTVEKEKINPSWRKDWVVGRDNFVHSADSLFKCDLKKLVFSLYGPFTNEQNEECRWIKNIPFLLVRCHCFVQASYGLYNQLMLSKVWFTLVDIILRSYATKSS